MDRKAKFAWASIAGADPEPVELIEENGRAGLYTCGCADPFWLDDPNVIIRIGSTPLSRPISIQTKEEMMEAQAAYLKSKDDHPRHGWRGPR